MGGLLAALLIACGAPETPDRTEDGRAIFVGGLSGSDAAVALVERGDRFIFYSCGGDSAFDKLTVWFGGATGAERALKATNDDFGLEATFDGEAARGSITTPNGDNLIFVANVVEPGAVDGLFRATGGACNTGTIVRQSSDGSALSLQGVGCTPSGAPKQVTPVGPIEVLDSGIEVQVDGGMPERLRLAPAMPE